MTTGMKMVMAVVGREEAEQVIANLIAKGHTATYTESRGGILRQSQLTLFVVVPDDELDEVMCIVRDHCRSDVSIETDEGVQQGGLGATGVTAAVGGAVVFVWDLVSVERS